MIRSRTPLITIETDVQEPLVLGASGTGFTAEQILELGSTVPGTLLEFDCPADAIHRAPNGEVYIKDNCIGCGNCERNCPYGVIHMSYQMPRKPGSLSWLMFGRGPGPGQDMNAKGTGQKKAVKCDMCKDLPGGAACVRACPTGAALRISPEDFVHLVSAKQ